MKKLDFLFEAYSQDHQNAFNQKVHLFCVPLIVYSLMGFLWALSPVSIFGNEINLAILFSSLISIYYFYLSFKLAIIMILSTLAFFGTYALIQKQNLPLLHISIVIFVVAWLGQFYGHKVEGKKPSFLTDLTYLFIGPLWVVEKLSGRQEEQKSI